MRDRDLRQWRALVKDRANREWRELSFEVVDELACHLADLHAAAIRDGASDVDAWEMALDTLGISPLLGRTFTDADDRRGGGPEGPVAVVSYAFWQRRFGGAADVIGRREVNRDLTLMFRPLAE